jgi:hypothetical protein
MRTPRFSSRITGTIHGWCNLFSCVSLLALALMWAGGATPVLAWNGGSHGPHYTLEVTEGETTLPEHKSVASTGGSVQEGSRNQEVVVSISHNGTTVYRHEGDENVWLGEVPQVGETVTLESPAGKLIGSFVYDGQPKIAPSVCAGSTNFAGENTSGFTVKGSYVTYSYVTPYHRSPEVQESNFGQAQVTTLSGTTFGGSFLAPLELGETVAATESLETPLAGGGTFTYVSESVEPVKGCPAPPPVVSPPAAVVIAPPLKGSILGFARATIFTVLKSGWRDHVSINQAGTVTQDLYLKGGKLPASAASAHKHHAKTPPALLLARGVTTANAAGTVSVLLKLTAAGRHKLKSAGTVNAVLVTTLRTSGGKAVSLPPHSLSLHR